MEFKEIINKQEWDTFVISQPFYTFMNSWDWGEFNKITGSKIFRLGGYENGKLISAVLLIKLEARRGTHLFCPYGPLIQLSDTDIYTPSSGYEKVSEYLRVFDKLMPAIIKKAREESLGFVRINPLVKNNQENLKEFKKRGFKFAPMHVHAEDNWLLNLNKPEEDLLKDVRKTARYLIKRAIKEGVIVKKNNSGSYISKFIKMHIEHSNRGSKNAYTPFSASYIKNLFKTFPDEDINLLYAEYNGNIEAMLVSIKYGRTAAYYLGVSDIKHPKFSPAYLLQWEAIKKAREQGCIFYNFWGISPDDNPNHPLSGVSLFKMGFGGYEYKLLHVQDMPLSRKYWVNWVVETMRRKKRGYYYKK